jgi:cytochrome P450
MHLSILTKRILSQFLDWAKQYGEIFSFRLGPQMVVVLNSPQAADELLGNRSKIYSSRVPPHIVHDLMSAGSRPVFLPYGEEWKV